MITNNERTAVDSRNPCRTEYPKNAIVKKCNKQRDTSRRSIKLILVDEYTFSATSPHEDNLTAVSWSDCSTSDKDEHEAATTLVVSWFEGTSSADLQRHVNKSVVRKLSSVASQPVEIDDVIITDGFEEVVLTPHIPNGSSFHVVYTRLKRQEEREESSTLKVSEANNPSERIHDITVLGEFLLAFVTVVTISAKFHEIIPPLVNPLFNACTESINTCAADEQTLFNCIREGSVGGLFAGVCLWLEHSRVFNRNIFLFGFDSPKKMWIVLYESFVSSICWGISYLFIRRAMNPETRNRYIEKYWKDAVYGSMAGFNATFMKAVLKNFANPRRY
eukprot:CAMPEP_0113304874 /NCGR_PEP_ID=MMETSP0010_2-20120614/4712_1 /TAXON_ID=216773 ORGANISM="Corethron hystrix, Strain 308" /NCGR_SAMPLE_ID=MMETSP0010_2 /ASSEMBLY_ACC=CAM_ASM_000155 /LENGTH=332 /DNA_ID=CAMNT_0000159151 /DNA_START=323 /DNA_END=1321 /DNA_ORIENTATION=- /assembly_acc=CAM_ASM_000155